jgi:hypothetical protein
VTKKRFPDINTAHRETEKSVNLTVVNNESRKGACPACGSVSILFNCQLFREEHRPIACFCKSCAVARAGGEEKIWVRSDIFLRRRWERNDFGEKPERLKREKAI